MVQGSIEERQQYWVSCFEDFLTWEDRYAYLIELGEQLVFSADWQNSDNKVEGCQSQVWLHVERASTSLRCHAYSDSSLVRGLLFIIMSIYDKQSIQDIVGGEFFCFEHIGFCEHLTPARNNGVFSVLQALKSRANENL